MLSSKNHIKNPLTQEEEEKIDLNHLNIENILHEKELKVNQFKQ